MPEPYYSDEHVTLYHGDCLEVIGELRSQSIDLILTDPPFFMPAQQYAGRDASWQRTWADTSILATWWTAVVVAATRLVKSDGHFLAFCDDASYPVFYPPIYTRWPNIGCLVWDKGRPGMGTAWRSSSELIIAARQRSAFWSGGAAGTVLRADSVHPSSRVHPVDKPETLLRQLIEPSTRPVATVLDPFAGGGSTLTAAASLGRKAIGVELEERYCEIIARRLDQQCFDFGEGA